MMTHTVARAAVRAGGDDEPVVAAMRAGDEPAFATLVERHTRELQAHCRRMIGSASEAEDVVQETLLRAWRKRATFEGRSTFRTWLYRIATNACLDELRRRSARPVSAAGHTSGSDRATRTSPAGVSWFGGDGTPEAVAPPESQPEAVVVARETFANALLGTIEDLPPRQRAVLVLRDAFGWSAADAASLLDTTIPAANSALQRARATMRARQRHDDADRGQVALIPT